MMSKDEINSAKIRGGTTFQNPKEIIFSHQYIANELEKFNLNLEGCSKCGPAHQHFIDPRSHYDTLTDQLMQTFYLLDNPRSTIQTEQGHRWRLASISQ